MESCAREEVLEKRELKDLEEKSSPLGGQAKL
jgi:hypothetical protein